MTVILKHKMKRMQILQKLMYENFTYTKKKLPTRNYRCEFTKNLIIGERAIWTLIEKEVSTNINDLKQAQNALLEFIFALELCSSCSVESL